MKKILLITILLLLSLSLISCHKKQPMTEFFMPDDFDDNAHYNISFWAKNDTNLYQKRIYEQAVSDFESLYPNINVNIKSYNNYDTIYQDVITNIATNSTPNVCITYPDHVATYLEGDSIMVSLDELIDDPLYGMNGSKVRFNQVKKDEIIKKYYDEGILNNTQYLLPFMRSTEALYINVDMLTDLGYSLPDVLTWDFVFDTSVEAINKYHDNRAFIPFIYKSTDNMMIQLLKQYGYDYSNNDGEILMFNDNTLKILKKVENAVVKKSFSTFKYSGYPGNFFNAGNCLYAIDSTAGATWIGSDAPLLDISKDNVVQFTTAVRCIPQVDINNPSMISQGPSLCLFNKRDKGEVVASWLFMQFLLTNKVQINYSETEGYMPVTSTAIKDPTYIDYLSRRGELVEKNVNGKITYDNSSYYSVKIDATKILLSNTENTFITPVFNGSASLRQAAGKLIEDTLKNVKKNLPCDDAFYQNAYSQARALIKTEEIAKEMKFDSLPPISLGLLIAIPAIWLILGSIVLYDYLKKRKY